jgi:hypothetical protein
MTRILITSGLKHQAGLALLVTEYAGIIPDGLLLPY